MNWRRLCSASIGVVMLGVASSAAFAADPVTAPAIPPRIPIEAFAAGENFASPAISPNGENIVFITHVQGARYIAVRNLADSTDRPILRGEGGTDNRYAVRYCWFKSDRRIVRQGAGAERSRWSLSVSGSHPASPAE